MGTDGIGKTDSNLNENVNEMEGGVQYLDDTSLLTRRREEEKKKTLVEKIEFNGYYYYYYSDFTQSPTIGPSMSPSIAPTFKKVQKQPLVTSQRPTKAIFNHHFGTPYSATATIVAGCLFFVISIGFFAYAKHTRKADEILSKTIDRISKLKPKRGGKNDKGKKGQERSAVPVEETGSETYLCEDEENRTLSDHNSTCAAESDIEKEEVAEFQSEANANVALSPLFLGNDDDHVTSTRSGLSPPSHLGLLTSEQFVDETIPPPAEGSESSTSKSSSSSPRLLLSYMSARFEDSGKFIKKQMESLQKSMSPKSAGEDSEPETVDIEICETPKNNKSKDSADGSPTDVDHNDDDFTVSNVGCAASVVSLGMTVASSKQEDSKQEESNQEDENVTPHRSKRLMPFVASTKLSGGKLFRKRNAKDNTDGASVAVEDNDDENTVSNVGCSAASVASLGISVASSKQEEEKVTPNRSNRMMSFVTSNSKRSGGKFFRNKLISSKGDIDADEISVSDVDMVLESNMPKQQKHFNRTVREVDFSVASDLIPEEEQQQQGVTEIYSTVYSEDEYHDDTVSTSVISQDGSESVITLLDKCSSPEEKEQMLLSNSKSSTIDSNSAVHKEKDDHTVQPKVEGEFSNGTNGMKQETVDSLSADQLKTSEVGEEKAISSCVGEKVSISDESTPVTCENIGSTDEEVTKSDGVKSSPNDNSVSQVVEQTAGPSSEVTEGVALQIATETLVKKDEEEPVTQKSASKDDIKEEIQSASKVENTPEIVPVDITSKDDIKEEEILKNMSKEPEPKNNSDSNGSIVDKVGASAEKGTKNHTDNIIDLDQQQNQHPDEGNINSHESSEIKTNLTIRVEEVEKVKAEPSPTSVIPDIFSGEFKEDEKIA